MKYRNAAITSIIAALIAVGLDMASIQVNKGEITRISETLASFLEQSQQQTAQVGQAVLPPIANLSDAPTTATSSILYEVVKVVDGDTLSLAPVGSAGNGKITVRLIGLDTPESVDPRKPVQCFGKEASAFLKETIGESRIRLELDPSQGEKDRYGRTLAYAYREDGLFLNLYMLEEGYGFEYTYSKAYLNQAKFKQAQAYAEYHQNGLWASGACDKIEGIRS